MTGKRARQQQVTWARRDQVILRRLRERLAPYEPPQPCPVCDGLGRSSGCPLCGVTMIVHRR